MTPVKMTGAKTTRHPGVKRLADGRWHVVKTWVDPHTGRKVYREKVVAGTIEEAVRAREALRGREASASGSSRPRLGDFAKAWLERKKPKVEPSTFARYTLDVEVVPGCQLPWFAGERREKRGLK